MKSALFYLQIVFLKASFSFIVVINKYFTQSQCLPRKGEVIGEGKLRHAKRAVSPHLKLTRFDPKTILKCRLVRRIDFKPGVSRSLFLYSLSVFSYWKILSFHLMFPHRNISFVCFANSPWIRNIYDISKLKGEK